MAHLPGRERPPFWEAGWFGEALLLGLAIAAVIIGVVPLFVTAKFPHWAHIAWTSAIAILALICVIRVRAIHAAHEGLLESRRPDSLIGCLEVLHRVLIAHNKINESDRTDHIRIAIRRVVPPKANSEPTELEQITPYVGGDATGAWRKAPVYCGVGGLAYRTRGLGIMTREVEDYELYIDELVTRYSYTEEQARRLSKDRMAFLAVPIFDPGNRLDVTGVVYIDSLDKAFFTPQSQAIILAASEGISRYAKRRL